MEVTTDHGLEGDVAVLLEGGLALLLGGGAVVGDVGHVALLLVAVVALDGAVVHGLLHLRKKERKKGMKKKKLIHSLTKFMQLTEKNQL